MSVLFHLDSSRMGEQSVSRRLTGAFARLWRSANPQGRVIYRDIADMRIPVVDADWVAANYTPAQARTARQRQIMALSTELTQELLDADDYVLGVPMHNWGPAASFKLWADQIVAFERTMRLTQTGMEGALQEKRLTVFITAGRRYGPSGEDRFQDHVEPWLRTLFGNLGIGAMHLILVEGTVAVQRGDTDMAAFLAPHLAALRPAFVEALALKPRRTG